MTVPLTRPDLLRTQCLIGGQWLAADDGACIEVRNPASGALLATVPKMGAAETRRAIEAAQAAWPAWREQTAAARAGILRRWFELVLAHQDDLALLMTSEQGKPLAEAKGEVAYAASFLEWFAEEGKRVYGDTIPGHGIDKRIVVLRQPVGVTAAITPWNFPLAMITRKAGPALAAGCPMVLKPASQTPLSALALAALAEEAGVPAGVFSVVTGAASAIGGELAANPLVRKLSFTGSTAVGLQLATQCGATLKRLSMELGGNAPFIVFDDADMDKAVTMAMGCKFRNAGQTCICANRFLVQNRVVDAFTTNLLDHITALRVGDGLKPEADMGPLINADAVAHTDALVKDAVEKGAQLLIGGKPHNLGGNFYEPTLLLGLTPEMRIFREEIFGPVAAIMPFDTEEQAVELANRTAFGLASYVCTRDMPRIWRLFNKLQYGMAGFNDAGLAAAETPFGGVKFSGIGREGSREGLQEYMETHYALLGGLN